MSLKSKSDAQHCTSAEIIVMIDTSFLLNDRDMADDK